MSTVIETSAPGKLFLIGEYAVLDDAPALLTAVDRRAHVCLTPATDGHWQLSADNLGIRAMDLGPEGAIPGDAGPETRQKLRVFDAVLRTVNARLSTPLPAQHVAIDTTDFARDGHKLGLGSSAAVAAALTCALGRLGGQYWPQAELTQLAIDAHRTAQNGAGSGGDVAVAVYGGLIIYRRDQTPIALDWPRSLVGMAVVTGDGASTPDLVARVRALADNQPAAYKQAMDALTGLADRVQQSLSDTTDFLNLADDYFRALGLLDRHAGAGIISHRHHELHALAAQHHAVFKSSGAGGGDVGLLFVERGANETAVRSAFDAAGADILPLVFGADGTN